MTPSRPRHRMRLHAGRPSVGVLVLVALGAAAPASAPLSPRDVSRPAAAATLATSAPQTEPGMLVSADWLAEHLSDPGVVVLHADARRERYDEGHIPGARFLDMAGLAWEGDPPVGTQMRTPAEVRAALEAAGVRDGQRVVVYGADPLQAARAWMTMDVMGWGTRASMLDGGFGGWKEDGRAVSTETPAFAQGSVTLHPRADVVMDADWVLTHLEDPAVTVIDARTHEQYVGADGGGNGRLHAGHIPGAFNVDADSLMESRAVPRVRDRVELEALFRASGVADGGTVVTYCVVGLRASFAYFVARLLGYDAKLYDGSWREWGSGDLPYVSGPSRR